MDTSKLLILKINKEIPNAILEKRRFGRHEEVSFWIEMQAVLKIAKYIKEDQELLLDWLENLSAAQVDDALVLSYFLRSSVTGRSTILRGSIVLQSPNEKVEVTSIVPVWPMGQIMEKEIEDFFGIHFKGNPMKGRFFLPEKWTGYPLRKAYGHA